MTLRHTRPSVPSPPCVNCTHDHCECLRRQVNYDTMAEAVIEAARAQVNAEGRVTEEHHRLVDALAALDAAQKDGQTETAGVNPGAGGNASTRLAPAAAVADHGDPAQPAPAVSACPSCGMGEAGTWDTHFDAAHPGDGGARAALVYLWELVEASVALRDSGNLRVSDEAVEEFLAALDSVLGETT